MASFIRTPRGSWKAIVRRRGWPTTCRTFRLKRDAQDWARHIEDGIRRNLLLHLPTLDRTLFAEALDRYLREVTIRKRPTTQAAEQRRVRPIRAFFGRYMLSAITPDLIARYRQQRLTTPTRSPKHPCQPPSAATVRLELIWLAHLFNVATREWHLGLADNPVDRVQVPPPARGRERRLALDEESRLMAALARHRNPMLGWIVRLAIETGMRAGEIRQLRTGEVDLQRRTVLLPQTKNGSVRSVPLSKAASHVLTQALEHPGRPPRCDWVFFGPIGKSGTSRPYGFRIAWWKLKTRLGLHNLHFHDLRHEAISRLVEAGLSDQQVAAISGHRSMQMLKRYTHLRAEDLVAVLDRHLPPGETEVRVPAMSPRMHRVRPRAPVDMQYDQASSSHLAQSVNAPQL